MWIETHQEKQNSYYKILASQKEFLSSFGKGLARILSLAELKYKY